jgi:hypothetical protein
MDNKTQQGPPPQVDDLLQIDANSLTADSVPQPAWVKETLSTCPLGGCSPRSGGPTGSVGI